MPKGNDVNKKKIINKNIVNFFFLAIFSSCTLIDPTPVIIPSYIYVPSVGFTTTNTGAVNEGEASSKFVDVWIYDNGNTLGTIGLPALIPDQKSGLTTIAFDAGIMKSGQDEDRIPYPFVARFYVNCQLSPNKTDTFHPVFKYISGTQFEINEGFETPGTGMQFSYNPTNTPGDTLIKVRDSINLIPSIKLGKFSGQIKMSATSQFFEILSAEFQKDKLQPIIGLPVYLELDYKSDVQLNIILWSRDQNANVNVLPQLTTNPTSTWNKVYVCLDQDISAALPGSAFKISLRVLNNTGIQPNIFIDNIKLLHF